MSIDRKRYAAVGKLEALGFRWHEGKWIDGPANAGHGQKVLGART